MFFSSLFEFISENFYLIFNNNHAKSKYFIIIKFKSKKKNFKNFYYIFKLLVIFNLYKIKQILKISNKININQNINKNNKFKDQKHKLNQEEVKDKNKIKKNNNSSNNKHHHNNQKINNSKKKEQIMKIQIINKNNKMK